MALPDPVFARFPNRASSFSLAPSVITEAPRSKAQFVRAPADTAGVVVGHPELILRLRMSLRGPPGRRRRWSHRVVPGDRHPSPLPGGARVHQNKASGWTAPVRIHVEPQRHKQYRGRATADRHHELAAGARGEAGNRRAPGAKAPGTPSGRRLGWRRKRSRSCW